MYFLLIKQIKKQYFTINHYKYKKKDNDETLLEKYATSYSFILFLCIHCIHQTYI